MCLAAGLHSTAQHLFSHYLGAVSWGGRLRVQALGQAALEVAAAVCHGQAMWGGQGTLPEG